MDNRNQEILLEAREVCKYFPAKDFFGRKKAEVKAVDGVNLTIRKGETFGLVGESGCGKSTLGRTLIRMYDPTSGSVLFKGQDITRVKGSKLLPIHRQMQIIFQDPYSALDPHHNVREIIGESMAAVSGIAASEMDGRIEEMLKKVGMKPDDMYKYAYEFSGGQRQRIGIARALA
nr:ATP-binding cassette domain-containing protein [Lacrimispora celerecrescens]